jgi:hypothetical protein
MIRVILQCLKQLSCLIFSLIFSLNEAIRLITLLSVCVSPFQLLIKLVDLYETQSGGHVIEGDLDTILSNPIVVTIP